jgi:CheY-like chemotaxis protein
MSKKKILVVDDEVGITRALKRNLEATNQYEVRMENSSKAAVAAARDFLPDLIIMDVMMPEMDGGEVAALLKDDQRLGLIPIVFLSAIVKKDETKPAGANIGGQIFLAKPVKLDDLIACIEHYLGK